MTLWDRNLPEVTIAVQDTKLDSESSITDIAEKLEGVLWDFLRILNKLHHLSGSNPTIEPLLKRISLAVIAMSYVREENLDKTLELNLRLPALPPDGIDELIETTADIRDFHSYVTDEATAATQLQTVSGRLTHAFVRPEFPIIPDDEV